MEVMMNVRQVAGSVRAESYTRLPPPLHPVTAAGPRVSAPSTECQPNATSEEDLMSEADQDGEDDAGLLQRLATRHYYSYTAALGVTVGVGCLLLVLNMLIFAGIYYQRDRRRHTPPSTTAAASSEGIPLAHRPQQTIQTPNVAGTQSPAAPAHVIKVHEPPPCYTTVTKSPSIPDPPPPPRQTAPNTNAAPVPPVRTSSTPGGGTIKKRVQIQEISV